MEREYLSREPRQYTKKEKLQNWFYYNKWWLAVAALIVYVAGSMIWNALGIGQTKPDYRFAYLGSVRLPEESAQQLSQALASLGEDLNGDGQVVVELNQYITSNGASTEDMNYAYAAQMSALADITEGLSTFFLMEDPESFQKNFQILAHLDGSFPDDADFSAGDKVYRWADCPALMGLELGTYTDSYLDITETGRLQDWMSGMYLGRRYFYDESQQRYPQGDQSMWEALTEGVKE